MFVINQRVHISSYKSDIIQLQTDLIDAQKKSIERFDNKVTQFKNEISKTVQDTVESGLSKSYSAVVQSQTESSSVVTKDTLKSVAKQVVVEEGLSRNIMMFGLQEDEEEDLSQKVAVVFGHLGEKPRIEAIRMGKSSQTGTALPVKISLSSSVIIRHILSKSRKLRETEEFKVVFLAPDRTVEERERQKVLIVERKRKVAEDPNRRHYIRGNKVVTV